MIRELWDGRVTTYGDDGKFVSQVAQVMPDGSYAIEGMPPAATSEFVVAWSSPSDPATFDPTEDVCRRYNRSVGADGRGLGGLLDGVSQSVSETVIYGSKHELPPVPLMSTPPDLFALLRAGIVSLEMRAMQLRQTPASIRPGHLTFVIDAERPIAPAPVPVPSPLPPDIFALLIKATALRPDGTELSAPLAPSPLPPNLFARMERNRSQAVNGAAHFVDQE